MPSGKVIQDGYTDMGVNIVPPLKPLPIHDVIQVAMSQLFAWDYLANHFRQVICDADGRILVSQSPTKAQGATHSYAQPTTTPITLLANNPDRREFIIQNTGTVACYITLGDTLATTTAIYLQAGVSFSDYIYTGVITARSESGTGYLRVTEMI